MRTASYDFSAFLFREGNSGPKVVRDLANVFKFQLETLSTFSGASLKSLNPKMSIFKKNEIFKKKKINRREKEKR